MTKHAKMPREERAKQFLPFAALKGYPEALREKEEEIRRAYEEEEAEKKDSEHPKFRANSCEQRLRCDAKNDRIN